MNNDARSALNEALILTATTIIAYAALAIWWKSIVALETPSGVFWALFGVIGLATLVAVFLMPAVCLQSWQQFRLDRQRA